MFAPVLGKQVSYLEVLNLARHIPQLHSRGKSGSALNGNSIQVLFEGWERVSE